MVRFFRDVEEVIVDEDPPPAFVLTPGGRVLGPLEGGG